MSFIPSHIEPRATYLERVQPFIGKNLIKVFTGQRRVGKSYLLFQIMEQVKKDYSDCTIVYVNKEDLLFSALQTAQDLHDYVVAHEGKTGKTDIKLLYTV